MNLDEYLNNSPTSFHAGEEAARLLVDAGYTRLSESSEWSLEAGGRYLVPREGSALIAFRLGTRPVVETGFRAALAHLDSPALKLKPRGLTTKNGYLVCPVEVYGSPIISTWLDRDLGVAGRLERRVRGKPIESRLVRTRGPVASIPNPAIHLNRNVNEGFEYNNHEHLQAVFGAGEEQELLAALSSALYGEATPELTDPNLYTDLYLYDANPLEEPAVSDGVISSGRIDNLAGAFALLEALRSSDEAPGEATAVCVLFDHEEIGSRTAAGAAGSFLTDVLDRITESGTGTALTAERRVITCRRSFAVSNDAAHAVHPNFSSKHDPAYSPILGGGPVIKLHAARRYTSTAHTSSVFRQLADSVNVPVQDFVSRADVPMGSTVGPLSEALVGMPSVDVGIPILGMHSIREYASRKDVQMMARAVAAFFQADEL
jgi:aspartyl aminopeptidase